VQIFGWQTMIHIDRERQIVGITFVMAGWLRPHDRSVNLSWLLHRELEQIVQAGRGDSACNWPWATPLCQ